MESPFLEETSASPLALTGTEVAAIILEIEELEAKMSELVKQVQRRRTRLSHHACRIPLEILGEIFFMVFPHSTLGRHGRKVLIDLCLVCKYWRRAALLKRELWSGLRVGTDYLEACDEIVAWLERSGSHPKRLKLVDRFCAPNYEEWCFGPAVEVGYECLGEGHCQLYHPTVIKLLTEGPLLDSLGLIGASIGCLPHLLKSLKSSRKSSSAPWNSIRSLELEFRGSIWRQHASSAPTESIFYSLPPVTELHLYLPPWLDAQGEDPTNTPSIDIPPSLLRHLTTLNFSSDWDADHVLGALVFCGSLKELEIGLGNVDLLYGPSDELRERLQSSIRLPHLRHLRLSDQHPSVYILDFLVTPILEELSLAFGGYTSWTREDQEEARNAHFAKPILDFVERSDCHATLRSLHIHDREVPAPMELVSILLRLEHLTDLTLDGLYIDYTGVFFWLHNSSFASPCLPRLRRLSLIHFRPSTASTLEYLSAFLLLPRLHPCKLSVLFSEPSCSLAMWRRRVRRGQAAVRATSDAGGSNDDDSGDETGEGDDADEEGVSDNASVSNQDTDSEESDAGRCRNVSVDGRLFLESKEGSDSVSETGAIGSSHEASPGSTGAADGIGSDAGAHSTASEDDSGQTGTEEYEGDSDDGTSVDGGDSEEEHARSSWTSADIESSKSLLQNAHGASVTILARRESFSYDGTWWKHYFQADNIA